ncbi:MAG: glycosyltransferase [Oscillospiraceae bacterium]|nr:glycosyltransferase [Oscillospiraceae bacterium]
MKLSVIIPAYNAEETLEKCLDSVLAQTMRDLEVIVVNDGSTDNTEEILKRYPVRSLTVENGGQGRARNLGMEMAEGEFLGFVDSDDWIDPGMYEKLLRTAEDAGADVAICDWLTHYPDGKTQEERLWRDDCLMSSVGFASNKVIRRGLLEEIRFPEGLWYEDTDFTAHVLHRAGKVVHLPEMLYHYRRGYPSTMNNQNALRNLDILEVMDRLEEEFCPESQDDYEFLVLNHVLLDAMNRLAVMESEDRKMVMEHMRSYVKLKIPHLGRCRSFQRETRNRRIIMRLHYMGLSGLAVRLLAMKK